ncbi:MAG: hydroxyisourate hydrolase [Bauldia sp.]
MGRLTTHVLDLTRGAPAAGLAVELWRLDEPPVRLGAAITNADGRLDAPLLDGPAVAPGTYELRFHAGTYLRRTGTPDAGTAFLDIIPIRFVIADEAVHLHVPLLLSPYGYSTYRGS